MDGTIQRKKEKDQFFGIVLKPSKLERVKGWEGNTITFRLEKSYVCMEISHAKHIMP